MTHTFFDVPQRGFETSIGAVELPIFYYDASMVQAFFWCDLDRAATALDGTGLRPTRFIGGRTVVGVGFYEYRDTSIGSYNEVGVALVVSPAHVEAPRLPILNFLRGESGQIVGSYVLDLPVTTREAYIAGRELWGLPKFVGDIPVAISGRQFNCAVLDPAGGEPLVSLQGACSHGPTVDAFDLLLYSHLDDGLFKTRVDLACRLVTGHGRGAQLQVSASDHRMATNLRGLGLAGARPFLVQATDSFRSRLNSGVRIGTWRTPPLPYGSDAGAALQSG